jgi:hypothetical protein
MSKARIPELATEYEPFNPGWDSVSSCKGFDYSESLAARSTGLRKGYRRWLCVVECVDRTNVVLDPSVRLLQILDTGSVGLSAGWLELVEPWITPVEDPGLLDAATSDATVAWSQILPPPGRDQ